jgi:hypothetical protein
MEETLGNETTGRWKGPTTSKIVFVKWGLGSLTVLVLVVSVIGLYATVAAHATVAKAEADVRTLSSAIDKYKAHMGVLPARLADLMSPATNARGQTAGPYIGSIPIPPPSTGFFEYQYERYPDNQWRIFTSVRDYCGDTQRIEASAGSPPSAHPLSCNRLWRFWWLLFFPEKT